MTPREASEDYARRFTEMSANRDRDGLNIALEIKALVQLRIQTRGYDFREAPFSPYTPDYKRNRQKSGYQTDYVDFTRTGALWNAVRPAVVESTATTTVIEITARDDGNQAKLQGAVRKRGNILLVSDPEADILTRLNQQRVSRYFQ